MINYFQDGGQDPNDNTDFFNGLLDANMQQSGDNENIQEEQQPNEERDYTPSNDFIEGLSQYAEESKNTDLQSQIDELKQQLNLRDTENNLDQMQADLEEKLMIAQFYQTPAGEDELLAKYEPQANDDGSYAQGPKYTPVAVNNPGNLRVPGHTQFQQFATLQQGEAALLNQLHRYQTGTAQVAVAGTNKRINGATTLLDAMRTYAPKGDGKNNPTAYANFIAKQLGVPVDTKIGDLDTNSWAEAIKIMEGNSGKKRQFGGYAATVQGGHFAIIPAKQRKKYIV